MAIPFPPGAVAGAQSPGQKARQLLGDFVWLARWSDEIGSDADLNFKKLAQLAFFHCRAWADAVVDQDTIRAFEVFAQIEQGIEWKDRATMVSELQALKSDATAVFEHVRDNVPEARTFARRKLDLDGKEIEEALTASKADHQTAVDLVAALRANFA